MTFCKGLTDPNTVQFLRVGLNGGDVELKDSRRTRRKAIIQSCVLLWALGLFFFKYE